MIDEEESYMDIYSPPGTKVRFAANGGWEYDKEEAKKVLTLGKIYTVSNVDVHSSHSYVSLEGVNGEFNTVLFNEVSKSDPSLA